MSARRIRHLTTTWAFVVALLLKGAVPMLASAAATLQGKSVADVCSVYGVALPPARGAHAGHAEHAARLSHMAHGDPAAHAMPMHGDGPTPADHDGRHVGGDHCVLTALAAFASGAAPVEAARPAPSRDAVVAAAVDDAVPASLGAEARWRARLLHAPPAIS